MDSAVRAVKPAIPVGHTEDSVPPATITSASPYWMAWNASPIQWVPEAQAVTTFVHFPFRPRQMDMFPAAMLEIISGTISGFTLFGPFVVSFS